MMGDIDAISADDSESCPYPPWNFSWVVENKLAAFAWPQTVENLEFLVEEGVGHLVTLSAEKQPPMDAFENRGRLEWTVIDVDEFEQPSLSDILRFNEICVNCFNKNKAVGVHCRMGRGRTGVMLACYYLRFEELSPDAAITKVRLQRAGSIETPEQERAVRNYHDCLRGHTVT